VDRVGNQLFAGAVFSLDENIGVASGHALDQFQHLVHFLALADDVAKTELPLELLFQQQVFTHQIAALDGALQHLQQRVRFYRFFHEAMRPRFHRFDRLDDAAMAGDDDDLGVGVDLLEFSQQLEPVGIGQHHVGHDNVGLPGLENLFPSRPDHRRPDFISLVFQQDLQPFDHRGLVVDREHPVALLDGHNLPRSLRRCLAPFLESASHLF
jgi:hypothetical protein